jgi:hypothetical protein
MYMFKNKNSKRKNIRLHVYFYVNFSVPNVTKVQVSGYLTGASCVYSVPLFSRGKIRNNI